jgi:hypothetical protein
MDQSLEDLELPTRRAIFPPGCAAFRRLPLALPQHPHEHRPERPVLLAVDQQLGEGPVLRIAPELADPIDTLEVREREDVEKFRAGCGRQCVEALLQGALKLVGLI